MTRLPGISKALLILLFASIGLTVAAPADETSPVFEEMLERVEAGRVVVPLRGTDPEECVACELSATAPATDMILTMDELEKEVGIVLYYENESASPIRQPIEDAMIVIEAYNESMKEFWRLFTDENGEAEFNFAEYANGSATFKILYCPFCCPLDAPNEWCGWEECLAMASMEVSPGAMPEDIPEAPGETVPSDLNCEVYRPALKIFEYSPPPKEPEETIPALCTIGMIIFAFLGGALYMSGKNPFSGFSLARPMVGKHIKYHARGRGWSINVGSIVRNIRRASQELSVDEKTGERAGPTKITPYRRGVNLARGLAGYSARGAVSGGKGMGGRAEPGEGEKEGRAPEKLSDIVEFKFRESQAALLGGLNEDGERTRSRGEIRRNFSREVFRGLSSLFLGMIDRSNLGYMMGLRTSSALASFLGQDSTQLAARAAARDEIVRTRGNSFSRQLNLRGETEEIEGLGTCEVIALEDGRRVIITREQAQDALRDLEDGRAPVLRYHLEVDEGDGVTTRYHISGETMEGVQRVITEGENVTIANYDVDPGSGTLTLESLNVNGGTYNTTMDTEGNIVFDGGRVPEGMPATFEMGESGLTDYTGPAEESVASATELAGTTLGDNGMLDIDTTGRDQGTLENKDLITEIRDEVNENATYQTELYSEDLGEYRATRRGFYGQEEGLFSDDADIEILDPNAGLHGERVEREHLHEGQTIQIRDGELVSSSRPEFQDLSEQLEKGTPLAGPEGDRIELEPGELDELDIDIGGLLEHDRELPRDVRDAEAASRRFQQAVLGDTAEDFMSGHPDSVEAYNIAITESRSAREDGLSDQSRRFMRGLSSHDVEEIQESSVEGAIEARDPEAMERMRETAMTAASEALGKDTGGGGMYGRREQFNDAFEDSMDEQREEYLENLASEERTTLFTQAAQYRRERARNLFQQRAEGMFRAEHSDSPLSRFGTDIAHMDEGDVETGLRRMGYHDDQIDDALGNLEDIQESAREYVTGASHATRDFGQVAYSTPEAGEAFLGFVPSAEELAEQEVIPQDEEESNEEYLSRVEAERREIAQRVERAAYTNEYGRDVTGQLSPEPTGHEREDSARHRAEVARRGSLRRSTIELANALEDTAEEHGGTYQDSRMRFLSAYSNVLDERTNTYRSFLTPQWQEGGAIVTEASGVIETQAATYATNTIGAVARYRPEKGEEGLPNETIDQATESMNAFLGGPQLAGEPPPLEGLNQAVEDTQEFVRRHRERDRREREEEISEFAAGMTGARPRESEESEPE